MGLTVGLSHTLHTSLDVLEGVCLAKFWLAQSLELLGNGEILDIAAFASWNFEEHEWPLRIAFYEAC